jgi:methyl-accepting chemotaxis protein
VGKLGSVLDNTEAQAAKQRQVLEAALKLRNEPGGVVGTSETVSLAIRDMVGTLRLLMLAATEAEVKTAGADLKKLGEQLTADMSSMRAGLLKMGRPPLAAQVDAALVAMGSVSSSIGLVATSKQQLLASEAQMVQSLGKLKAMAAQQASLGEAQVKRMSLRQGEVVAAVDERVRGSLIVILGIAALAIVVTSLLSLHLVRTVTRRLNAAVQVAEQVSRGELAAVPASDGNDETTRLMAAMATMVGTLQGIVGNIRSAAGQIHVGSGEISTGNQDLSTRTERQSSQLQQTAASVDQLTATVQRNAESAHSASALASQASGVAAQGGRLVASVVHTMGEIETGSKQIAAIVSVIDGIAFQTNILALNAAVEAARAGEQGRGFAVVASEVRALAGKSAEAAREVKAIVDRSVQAVTGGAGLVRDAGATMQDIVRQVHQVSTLINEIAQASQEQAASVASVGGAVQTLDQLTQQNAALAEQGSAAAASLRQQAEGLTQAIAVFRGGTAPA